MAEPHDPWEFFAGNTWDMYVVCGSDDGDPIDITAATDIVYLLNSEDGVDNILRLALGSGVSLFAPLDGVCLVAVTKDLSAPIPPGIYRDMTTLYINGRVSTQTFGITTVRAMLRSDIVSGRATLSGNGLLSCNGVKIP